ncbi:hypothetical protein PHLCEN_2v8491 [Hermanssonia centrifuga]|uniref:Mediator of RNA polymerase II transcription subunit 8 n=1 Tax=Hermanssonia centrifuga TaxID=98765 RepID=A0A2R6NTJ5_9APHY|nr:hypothetical protein PHLCEN_2v8491 [Hermanssonia centrifuga]
MEQSGLPIAQLESLRSKINQMVESIQLLQRTIEAGGQNVMPAWPDILSKYTMLLSQSHNLSMSLVGTYANAGAARANGVNHVPANPYERLALHPNVPMTETQLDNDLIPLLRNQQTTDVLRLENETVRHLSEHMATRGSLGVLAPVSIAGSARRGLGVDIGKKTEYEDVLRECEQIRVEHDERVERAVRAVMLLREKYDWKARVEVDQEEPEELEWDPRLQDTGDQMNVDQESQRLRIPDDQSNDSEEEEELEEVLGNGIDQTPDGTPQPTTPIVEV